MSRNFTLAQAAEARRLLIQEVRSVLSVAAEDVQDVYEDSSLIDVFSVKCDPPSLIHGTHKDTRLAGRFAEMLVDRILADPKSGVILDYDPDAEYARADSGIFSQQSESAYQPVVKAQGGETHATSET